MDIVLGPDKIAVYTLPSPDGVMGLNGKLYLLDEDNETMLFETEEDARQYLTDAGVDPDGDAIGYQNYRRLDI